MTNPFEDLTNKEWLLWGASLAVVIISNIMSGTIDIWTLMATVIGVTALIFIAKGNVCGQVLTVIFSILYSIPSFKYHYYGEIITYMGMTAPIAFLSIITWLKNPYEGNKSEVKIHRLTFCQITILTLSTMAVTAVMYFVLEWLDTPNLIVSTISVTTSFLASSLMMLRNSYYALAYGANDIVLIILWIMATAENIAYLPMILCFTMFLINDVYGFISWKMREKKQNV